jgi:polyisoprenoid-binding protein YceI
MKLMMMAILIFSLVGHSRVIEITNENYNAAKNNTQFIRFDLAAWKVGIFKSTFKNYVKNFKVSFDREGSKVKNAEIRFKVSDMDTDIAGRNEKMWDFCLSMAQYPEVQVTLEKEIDLTQAEQVIPSKIKLRGKEFPIELHIKSEKKENVFHVVGKATTSLKELTIPDPSIAVASLEDAVQIYFELSDR